MCPAPVVEPRPPAAVGDEPLPLAVVMNVRSGHLDTDERLQQVDDALRTSSRRHRVWPVSDAATLAQAVQQAQAWAASEGGALVAAGGDGTINTVAQAAYQAATPLGVLPQGTFNYFARSHGLPVELGASLDALLQARPTPVQVGTVNGRLFLVNASLGLYPQVLADREAFKAQFGRYRFNAALSAMITVLRDYREWTLDLDLGPREVTVRSATLFVGNNRLQLDQLGLHQAQVIEKGLLAAVMVKPVGRLGLMGLALRGALGQLADAEAAVDFAFRRMTVRPRSSRQHRVAVALDGEVLRLAPPITFEVAPQPLQLLLPPDRPR
jgi:diacylglycerol kinase family enzyme